MQATGMRHARLCPPGLTVAPDRYATQFTTTFAISQLR